jgi:hypothetical protein
MLVFNCCFFCIMLKMNECLQAYLNLLRLAATEFCYVIDHSVKARRTTSDVSTEE